MPRHNPIVFPITQAIRDAYTSPADASLFNVDRLDLTGNYLVIWLFSEDYQSTRLTKEIRRGASKTYVYPSPEPYQFEASVKDGRRTAIDILKQLEGDVVEVLDFHVPDGVNPYTVRLGVLTIDEPGSFYSDSYEGNLSQGFRLLFEEV